MHGLQEEHAGRGRADAVLRLEGDLEETLDHVVHHEAEHVAVATAGVGRERLLVDAHGLLGLVAVHDDRVLGGLRRLRLAGLREGLLRRLDDRLLLDGLLQLLDGLVQVVVLLAQRSELAALPVQAVLDLTEGAGHRLHLLVGRPHHAHEVLVRRLGRGGARHGRRFRSVAEKLGARDFRGEASETRTHAFTARENAART